MRLALLLLAVFTLPAGVQDKTYELKLDWIPVKGHKSELTETTTMKMAMKSPGLPDGGVEMAEDKSFAAAEEVLKADLGGTTRRWKFSKAAQKEEGKFVPFGFQGKSVVVAEPKGKPREFKYEDGAAIEEADAAALADAFMGADEKEGEPSGTDLFAPKKPVKVGESWSPALKDIVATMFDEDMAAAVVAEKSKVLFTLKSAERRGASDFGRIEGVMEIALKGIGPLKLETPLVLKMEMSIDACIDGKLPDGAMSMKGSMKGKSVADADGTKMDLNIDMTIETKMTIKTVK